jgi:hypothetical protein
LAQELSNEISFRVSSDSLLTQELSNEVSFRVSSDSSLAQELSNEISLRVYSDSSLVQELSNEVSLRVSSDSSLVQELSNEVSFRVSRDSSLAQSLSSEVSYRVSGDSSLTQELSSEVSFRVSGDSSLAQALSNEIASRISADADVNATSVTTDSLSVTSSSTFNNTLQLRNSNVTTNQLNISVDELQNISFSGKSSSFDSNVSIKYYCDTFNTGTSSIANQVMILNPTSIEINRPITFNYLTLPTDDTQLGFIVDGTNSVQSSFLANDVLNAGNVTLNSGSWHVTVNFAYNPDSNSNNIINSTTYHNYAISNSSTAFPSTSPYLNSYISGAAFYNVSGNMTRMSTQLILKLSTTTQIYFLVSSSVDSDNYLGLTCNYSYTRIG